MTRKDYEKIADAIACATSLEEGEENIVIQAKLIVKLASVFREDNPRFDEVKFAQRIIKTYEARLV